MRYSGVGPVGFAHPKVCRLKDKTFLALFQNPGFCSVFAFFFAEPIGLEVLQSWCLH